MADGKSCVRGCPLDFCLLNVTALIEYDVAFVPSNLYLHFTKFL